MKKYKVKVQNSDGTFEFVNVNAENEKDALNQVERQGRIPVDASWIKENSLKIGLFNSVPISEIYHFTRLFATLTKSGVPILETLELLAKRAKNNNLRKTLTEVANDVKGGISIKSAFEKHNNVFDKMYLQLLEVGEESGNLPKILERLTSLIKKRIKLKSMIIKALTYPVLVLVISVIVVLAILIKIVPRFKDIYSRFGGDLPTITKFTLGCSDILIRYAPAVIIGTFAISSFIYIFKRTALGKRIFDRIILSLPLFGQMLHTYEIAGFSKSLSMLVHSGITVTGALALVSQSIERTQIRLAIESATEDIITGRPISESFDNQMPWLPELLNRMVAVGERSGNLPEMLDHVAEFYEEEFNNKVETSASLIEPVLIVFLGVVIGGIVISLYLPIFGMAKLIARR